MELTIITGNPGKAKEMISFLTLPSWIQVMQKDFHPVEIQSLRLEEVATCKALEVFEIFQEPFIMDDTGIFFEGYNEFPGAFTKYLFEGVGYEGILKLQEKNNGAYFKSVISYMDKTLTEPMLFTGITHGRITQNVDNHALKTLPYDNIFIPDGFDRTNSRLTEEEQKEINHRAKSLRSFSHFFETYAKKFA